MKSLTSLLAVIFALFATTAWACPGDKAKDDGKQSTPQKPNSPVRS